MSAHKGLLSAAIGTAAASLDRAVLAAVSLRTSRRPGRVALLGHEGRLAALAQIATAYEGGDELFPPPPLPRPRLDAVRSGVVDLSWVSGYEPYDDGVRHRYLSHEPNRTAHARLFHGTEARPAIIVIHGYLGGSYRGEERAWPIAWMNRIGLDVAMPVLPFHALRGSERPPRFPGADPRYTNEGFRQAVHDIRALVAYLRDRGAPSVGVMGMSLGGYTTALLATIERELAFAVPMIPLASIADFARASGRLGSNRDEEAEQHGALERAVRAVSPLHRPSLLPRERLLVIAGAADRITPIAHARRIADHFGARLVVMPGGHLLQVGRGEAFREVGRLLGRLGILPPRAPETP